LGKSKTSTSLLSSTRDLGLLITGSGDGIKCYPDASLGISDEKGESTSGCAIFLFGDLISWRTKKQTHVSLSSAEAEFVAMSLACRELANVSEMCKRLIKTKMVPIVYEDNKAAIELAQTEELTTLKHLVNLCYHYVRFEARCNSIKIEWINSNQQIGDFFTKALANPKFRFFRNKLMGIVDFRSMVVKKAKCRRLNNHSKSKAINRKINAYVKASLNKKIKLGKECVA